MVAKRTPGPTGAGSDDTARQAAADAAAAALTAANAAANARQMVLNRDPALAALQATADTASQAMSSSAADRADLRALLVAQQTAVTALQATVMALQASLAALPAPVVIASGQGKTASLLALGGSMDVVVTLSRTMPTTTYNVEILPVSTGLLPGAATIAVKAKTRTTLTLTITATVAVAASSVVSVLAWG